MNHSSLQSIYPNLIITDDKDSINNDFYLYDDQYYYIFRETELSLSEKRLLQDLIQSQKNLSAWERLFINNNSNYIVWTDNLRFVYFSLHQPIRDKDLFLQVLASFFDKCLDAFFIDDTSGCCVIQSPVDNEILMQQISVLESDFEAVLKIMVGIEIEEHDDINAISTEELKLLHSIPRNHGIFDYKDVYLTTIVKPSLKYSNLSEIIQKRIQKIDDAHQTIKALWENQGNLSTTSQALFIHRNTLNYRIDKFYDLTSLNLRNLDDLLLCYLHII